MRAGLVLTVAMLLAGCASGGSIAPEQTLRISGQGALRTRSGEGAKISSVNAPIEQVWRVLPTVFDSLGIPLTDIDPREHMLGNGGMKAFKALKGVPLSTYLDCGSTQAFPSADTYQVQMAVQTQADTAMGKTIVATLVEATGRPITVGGGAVHCATKGVLESKIASMSAALLSAGR